MRNEKRLFNEVEGNCSATNCMNGLPYSGNLCNSWQKSEGVRDDRAMPE